MVHSRIIYNTCKYEAISIINCPTKDLYKLYFGYMCLGAARFAKSKYPPTEGRKLIFVMFEHHFMIQSEIVVHPGLKAAIKNI